MTESEHSSDIVMIESDIHPDISIEIPSVETRERGALHIATSSPRNIRCHEAPLFNIGISQRRRQRAPHRPTYIADDSGEQEVSIPQSSMNTPYDIEKKGALIAQSSAYTVGGHPIRDRRLIDILDKEDDDENKGLILMAIKKLMAGVYEEVGDDADTFDWYCNDIVRGTSRDVGVPPIHLSNLGGHMCRELSDVMTTDELVNHLLGDFRMWNPRILQIHLDRYRVDIPGVLSWNPEIVGKR